MENELALRLFPFLCAVAGVFLFRRLAERALDGLAVPFAVGLYAIAVPFINYAAEVKQYGTDATVAIALLVLALDLRERDASTKRLVIVGLIGFVVVWFSQSSVLVMAGIGVALAIEWLVSRDARTGRALFITIPIWAVASLVGVAAGMRSMTPSTREYMDSFWAPGFFPLPMKSAEDLAWFWNQVLSFFTDPFLLRYRWPVLCLAVALVGFAARWRRRRDVSLLLLGPIFMGMVAAVAHQYPFRNRLLLYLVPVMLVALAAGAEWVRRAAGRLHPALGAAAMLALLAPPVTAFADSHPPYEIEHHRELLGFLQQRRQPGDVVYAFPLSRIGVQFYGPKYGLQPTDWTTAICDRMDTRAFVRDVDRYRGVPRFWLISSGSRPYRTARPAVQKYLATIGVRKDSLVLSSLTLGNVSVELYDLSDTTRMQSANAATFPVEPMPTDPRPGCRPWTRPDATNKLF